MAKEKAYWEDKEFAFFSHKKCESFPCHKGVPEEDFNCLFCFCPLYALGDKCGGNYTYLENGIKDCSNCTFPHHRKNYGRLMDRFGEISKLAARKEEPEEKD